MGAPELFANVPLGVSGLWSYATLAAAVSTAPAAGTLETWTLNTSPPSALGASGQFRFQVDDELCLDVTGGAGSARQVIRGVEGSTTQVHAQGAALYHKLTAGALGVLAQLGNDGLVGTPGQGGSQLTSTLVLSASGGPPAWAPNTAYEVNQLVVDAGSVYIAKAAHTSGTTFSPANWQLAAVPQSPINLTTTSSGVLLSNTLAKGDTEPAFEISGTGELQWGAGGANAPDTSLGRTAANTLGGPLTLLASGYAGYAGTDLNVVDSSNVRIASAGAGVKVAEGANCKQGVATLVAGTVTVANTAVTANSRILLTVNTPGGTVGSPYVSARVPGTSFTITSTSAADTSTVAYEIFEPA
jgi:hypothetical protein